MKKTIKAYAIIWGKKLLPLVYDDRLDAQLGALQFIALSDDYTEVDVLPCTISYEPPKKKK